MRNELLHVCLLGSLLLLACSAGGSGDDNYLPTSFGGSGGQEQGGAGGNTAGTGAFGGTAAASGIGGKASGGSSTAGTAGSVSPKGGAGGVGGAAAGGTAGTAGKDAGMGGTAWAGAGGVDAGADVKEAGPDVETDSGTPCQQALTATAWDFETAGGWTHGKMDGVGSGWTFDSWERGVATSGPGSCHGGTQCFATNLDDNYVQCQRAYLRSPIIDLSACAQTELKLVFWHGYDFWTGTYAGQVYYDGGTLEYSSNGGTTWATPPGVTFPGTIAINPDMGSSYSCVSSGSFHVDGMSGYTQASAAGWDQVEMAIPQSYRTSKFMVRFAYGSGVSYKTTDETTSMQHARPGWYVDDVSVMLQ